jgi:hypothetical protein
MDVAPVKPKTFATLPPKRAADIKPAIPRQKRSTVLKRQIVDSANYHQKQQKRERKKQWMAFVYGGVAASLVVTVGAVLYISRYMNGGPEAAPASATLGVSTSANDATQISEAPVSASDFAAFKANNGDPRLLRIPKLQLVARVLPVKAALNGEPMRPSNIYDAGWLITGGKLGDVSRATLIIGNVAGPSKDGIFRNVGGLAVGDEIKIDNGAGQAITYKVVQSKQYDADKVNMDEAVKPAIAGRPGVNLLTSTGRFNVKLNQFEKRTIVFASQQ